MMASPSSPGSGKMCSSITLTITAPAFYSPQKKFAPVVAPKPKVNPYRAVVSRPQASGPVTTAPPQTPAYSRAQLGRVGEAPDTGPGEDLPLPPPPPAEEEPLPLPPPGSLAPPPPPPPPPFEDSFPPPPAEDSFPLPPPPLEDELLVAGWPRDAEASADASIAMETSIDSLASLLNDMQADDPFKSKVTPSDPVVNGSLPTSPPGSVPQGPPPPPVPPASSIGPRLAGFCPVKAPKPQPEAPPGKQRPGPVTLATQPWPKWTGATGSLAPGPDGEKGASLPQAPPLEPPRAEPPPKQRAASPPRGPAYQKPAHSWAPSGSSLARSAPSSASAAPSRPTPAASAPSTGSPARSAASAAPSGPSPSPWAPSATSPAPAAQQQPTWKRAGEKEKPKVQQQRDPEPEQAPLPSLKEEGAAPFTYKDVEELEKLAKHFMEQMDKHPKIKTPGTTEACARCRQDLSRSEPAVKALGKMFHVHCFICFKCQKELQGQRFYEMDGEPLCEECHNNTLEKCVVCHQPITERLLRATGKTFHPKCFTCVTCRKGLEGEPFIVDPEGQVYCVQDYHRKFAPKCSVCNEPIVPEEGKDETVRIIALDKNFHVKCYRCEDCKKQLSSEADENGCYPLDGHILCFQCHTKRVNKEPVR